VCHGQTLYWRHSRGRSVPPPLPTQTLPRSDSSRSSLSPILKSRSQTLRTTNTILRSSLYSLKLHLILLRHLSSHVGNGAVDGIPGFGTVHLLLGDTDAFDVAERRVVTRNRIPGQVAGSVTAVTLDSLGHVRFQELVLGLGAQRVG